MKQILILQIILNRNLEYCESEIRAIYTRIAQPLKRAMHCSRNLAFVVTTRESPKELMERLAPVLSASAVESVWCYAAPSEIVSSRGGLDSLQTYVKIARAEIGQSTNTNNLREIEVRAPKGQFQRSEDSKSGTLVQMSTYHKGNRTPPKDPNGPKR